MGMMDALGGMFNYQQPQQMDAPPPPDAGVDDGGILGSLGISRDQASMLARSLAGGLGKVKSGTTAGESIAQALGGSLGGGNKYEDDERKRLLAELTQSDLNDYRNRSLDETIRHNTGTLGISQQNADTNAASGRYSLQNIQAPGPDGNPITKTVKFNSRTGEDEPFEAGVSIGKPGGAGGRESVFAQRMKVGESLYGVGTKEAADYAAGTKRLNRSDAMKFGMAQAETEIKENYQLSRTFKKPEDRDAYKNKRAQEIADTVLRTPELPGKLVTPAPPPPQTPSLMMPGNGGKPLDIPVPARPNAVPRGSSYSPSRRQWRDATGTIYDETGAPIQ